MTRGVFLMRSAAVVAAAIPAGALFHQHAVAARAGSVFDVRDHGAVGDASTDDTVAIQSALSAAHASGGGKVHLPAGAYRVTADLLVGSGTVVSGSGRDASVILRDPTPAAVAVFRNHDIAPTGREADIRFEKLAVHRQGECAKPNEPYDNAIQLRYVTRPVVRDCLVKGGGKGVLFDACSRWRVHRSRFAGFVDNAFVSAGYAGARNEQGHGLFSGNRIESPVPSGFRLGSSGVLTTQGSCDFVDNAFRYQATKAFEMGETEDQLIANNVALWSGKAGVHNDFLVGDCDDVRVVDNWLEMGNINFAYYDVGSDSNDRVQVEGNHVLEGGIAVNSARGASISHNTVDLGVITLNSVEDAVVDRNRVSRAAGRSYWVLSNAAAPFTTRLVRLSNNSAVDGNRTHDPGPTAAAFVVDRGDHVTLRGNVVSGDDADRRQRYGLYVNGTINLADDDNDFARVRTAARAPSTGIVTYAGFDVPLARSFPELRGG